MVGPRTQCAARSPPRFFFDAKVGVISEVNDMFGNGWVNGTVSVKVSLRNRDKEHVAYLV